MKEDIKPDDTPYYSYLLVYLDYILIVSHDPHRYIHQLQATYFVDPNRIMAPKLFLGLDIKHVKDNSGDSA